MDKSGSTVLYKLYAAVIEDMLHSWGCGVPMSYIISACVLDHQRGCTARLLISRAPVSRTTSLPGGCTVPMSHIISACVLHRLRACSARLLTSQVPASRTIGYRDDVQYS